MAQAEFSIGSCDGGLGRTMKFAFLASIAIVGLWAQNPTPPASTKPETAAPATTRDPDQGPARRREVYVRRFSIGASVSASLPNPTKNESLDQQYFNQTPALELQSNNSGKSSLLGFGLVGQVAVTDHWAVAVAPTLRTGIKFQALTVRLIGINNPNTIQDDREGTNLDRKVSARFFDVPILARYYRKSRTERGLRWYGEIGPRMRTALAVRSNTRVTPPPGKGDAFDSTDPISYRKRINGGTAGFGLQFIDDFGIRFVPEVRYTRWFGSNFGDINGRSKLNQVEIVFTLSF